MLGIIPAPSYVSNDQKIKKAQTLSEESTHKIILTQRGRYKSYYYIEITHCTIHIYYLCMV